MTELRLGGSLPNRPLKLRLKEIREAQGLTREELAARVGCSRMTILRLERGDGRPNARDLDKLAKALGVTVKELLTEAAPPR
jgi:putative transcriptional regulator